MLLRGIALPRNYGMFCGQAVALRQRHIPLEGGAFGDIDGDIALHAVLCAVYDGFPGDYPRGIALDTQCFWIEFFGHDLLPGPLMQAS
jgi:hypothetical protein